MPISHTGLDAASANEVTRSDDLSFLRPGSVPGHGICGYLERGVAGLGMVVKLTRGSCHIELVIAILACSLTDQVEPSDRKSSTLLHNVTESIGPHIHI